MTTNLNTVAQQDRLHQLRHGVQLAENTHNHTEVNGFVHTRHAIGKHNLKFVCGRGVSRGLDPIVTANREETKSSSARGNLSPKQSVASSRRKSTKLSEMLYTYQMAFA